MNNDIFEMDLTRTLPPILKNDDKIRALSQTIAKELQETALQIKNNIIYSNIDALPENLIDLLAYDLHIDWYNYDYPIRIKRELVKTSIKVHKKLGTIYAVETALSVLHPQAKVQEWFEYGGEPFFFRINIYVTFSRLAPEAKDIIRVVNIYKRLTAHLDKIIYRFSTAAEVKNISVGGMAVTLKVKAKVNKEISTVTENKNIAYGGISDYEKIKAKLIGELDNIVIHSNVITVSYTNIMYIYRKG